MKIIYTFIMNILKKNIKKYNIRYKKFILFQKIENYY